MPPADAAAAAGPVALVALGTRGDVAPFVALGRELKRRGLEVRACVPASLVGLAEAYGVPAVPLDDGLLQLKDTPEGRAAVTSVRARIRLYRQIKPFTLRLLDSVWAAVQGAAAIVCHPKALAGPHAAERLGVPCLLAIPLPILTPTSEFPSPVGPKLLPGRLGNRFGHRLVRLGMAGMARMVNEWREAALKLPAAPVLGRKDLPILYAYSRHLVPVPADWPPHAHVTGDWPLSPPAWQPPEALDRFLGAGPPPVYVGFGSMWAAPDGLTETVQEALARARVRALLAPGWGALDARARFSSEVFLVEDVPHAHLFPRVAAVVHHGGAGTTHAGLRAGRPTVICPFFGDQPFWGRRVHALGAGPAPLPLRRLKPARLAEAIRVAVEDAAVQREARRLGELLSSENGPAVAAELIQAALAAKR